MTDFFKLKRIDLQLQEVIGPVTFFDVNPLNLDSEKALVLKDPNYNPYFIYPDTGFDFDDVQDKLDAIDEHESPLGKLMHDKRNLFIDKCEMLKYRGSSRFTTFCKKVYGIPTNKVLEHAGTLLNIEPDKEDKRMTSAQAASLIQAEVNHYGFDYTVHTKPMATSAMVLVAKKKILVKDNYQFSDNFIRRLIIHEIGTHVLRAENGKEQPFQIFFHGFPNYLATEEGLAVYNEERFGLLSNDTLRDYAARCIAVQMALTCSFSDIYNYLLEFFPPSTAFKLTTRAKRGLGDTSKPGGCTKDYIYIDGYLKVKNYLDNGGSLNLLYFGKVGLEHLKFLQDIPGLSRPRFMPQNQSFKSLLSF
jgi:uncharacterized protein (TIGR02421 family)